MTTTAPTPETMLAYALGGLTGKESAAVRRWLVVQTDERILDACRAVLEEADRRRARLAHWAEHPARACLARAVWRARAHISAKISLSIRGGEARRPVVFTPLGAPAGRDPHRVVQVPVGDAIDLEVTPDTHGHLAVFGVDGGGALHVLRVDQIVPAGAPIELAGFVLEGLDDTLEVYLLLDRSQPVPTPGPEDDATWLAALLDRIAEPGDRSFVRHVFLPAPRPASGKQP